MTLKEKYTSIKEKPEAILATNFYNFETLRAEMEAAAHLQKPIILQLTQSSIDYMGLENAVNMGKIALQYYDVEGWIHLDHGGSVELAKKCIDAGFDSVMFDGSELPLEQNMELTRKVVKMAAEEDICVEAELGYIAKLGQSTEKMEHTTAEDAQAFSEATGIDALAIAIGTAHGFYKSEPKLDFTRLAEIKAATNVALVLHGGSGVPHEAVKKAVELGIKKLNVATEIKNAFMMTLKDLLSNNEEIDLRKVFPPAIQIVKELVEGKLLLVS
ncbi:MAG: ketose-bisphosphate aldolase [Bacteroidetes bacterium]|nr:MAG: ketose-bisphosphate aldolase [Bacteroidota bacterium]